jgi:hypothetical protein
MQIPQQRPQAEEQRLHASAATQRDLEDLVVCFINNVQVMLPSPGR